MLGDMYKAIFGTSEPTEEEQIAKAIEESIKEQTKGQEKSVKPSKRVIEENSSESDDELQKVLEASIKDAEKLKKKKGTKKRRLPANKNNSKTVAEDEDDQMKKAFALSLQQSSTVAQVPEALLKAKVSACDNLILICNVLDINEALFTDLKNQYFDFSKGYSSVAAPFEKADLTPFVEAILTLSEEEKGRLKRNIEQKLNVAKNSLVHQVEILNKLISASKNKFADLLAEIKEGEMEDHELAQAIQMSLKNDIPTEKKKVEIETSPSINTKVQTLVTSSTAQADLKLSENTIDDPSLLKIRQALTWSNVKGEQAQQSYIDLLAKLPVEQRLITLQKYLHSVKQITLEGLSAHLRELQQPQPQSLTLAYNEAKSTTPTLKEEVQSNQFGKEKSNDANPSQEETPLRRSSRANKGKGGQKG